MMVQGDRHMENKNMVSVICLAYNHEPYITQAMEGFVNQITDFDFEILVHDDASTDKTAEIIRGYEVKYPSLIKPIYQSENQYSQGKRIVHVIIETMAIGKYIAICEGDDYWTDPYKLQKQVDHMEKHPECSLCVHGAVIVNAADNKVMGSNRPSMGNRYFSTEDVIKGGGGLFTTNSILYPSKFTENRPDFYKNSPIGDYPLVIYLSMMGSVYYIDELMSAYRTNVPNSWTDTNFSSFEKKSEHFKDMADLLDQINIYSGYKYNDAIVETKQKNYFDLLLTHGKYAELKKGESRELYLSLNLISKAKIFIKQYCPRLTKLIIIIKNKLR